MGVSSTVRGKVLRALLWKETREVAPWALLLGGIGFVAAVSAPWWNDSRGGHDPAGPLLRVLFGVLAVLFFGVRAAAADAARDTRPTIRALPSFVWLQRGIRYTVGLSAVLAVYAAANAGGAWEADSALRGSRIAFMPDRASWSVAVPGWSGLYLWVLVLAGAARSQGLAVARVLVGLWLLQWLVTVPGERLQWLLPGFTWDARYAVDHWLTGFGPTGGFGCGRGNSVLASGFATFVLLGSIWVLFRQESSLIPRLWKIGIDSWSTLGRTSCGWTLRWNPGSVLIGSLWAPLVAGGFLVFHLIGGWHRTLTEPDLVGLWLLLVLLQAALLPLAVVGAELQGQRPWFWRSLPITGRRWFTLRFLPATLLLLLGWGVTLSIPGLAWSWVRRYRSEGPWWWSIADGFSHPQIAVAAVAAAAIVALGFVGTAWSRRPLESGVMAGAAVLSFGVLMGYTPDRVMRIGREGFDVPLLGWAWPAAGLMLAAAWALGAWSFHRRVA